MAHRIRSIRPRGFLSFAADTERIELEQLNLLVGANGSGKSNLIEAARFLSMGANASLRANLTRHGSRIADWCFNDGDEARVEVVSDGPGRKAPLRYELAFANEQSLRISSETLEEVQPSTGKKRPFFYVSHERAGIKVNRKTGRERTLVAAKLDASSPVLEQIRDPMEYPELEWMRSHLTSYRFATEAHIGGAMNPLRTPQSATQEEKELLENGRNLPLVVNQLHQQSGFRQRLIEHMREVYPSVDQIEMAFVMGETQLVFLETARGRRTPSTRLSDGTLRWLMLGILLLDPRATTPLFLDEPELALHPDAIIPLARLLRAASTRRQLIVSTHSESLLSEFTSTPEVVLVFDRVDGATQVERLDSASLGSWLKTHQLGEIWKAGRIGGTRW